MKKYWETGEKNKFGKECYKLHFSQFYEEENNSQGLRVLSLCGGVETGLYALQ